jgi:hypothetical protein
MSWFVAYCCTCCMFWIVYHHEGIILFICYFGFLNGPFIYIFFIEKEGVKLFINERGA